jgi:hypothetical protein
VAVCKPTFWRACDTTELNWQGTPFMYFPNDEHDAGYTRGGSAVSVPQRPGIQSTPA